MADLEEQERQLIMEEADSSSSEGELHVIHISDETPPNTRRQEDRM